VLVELAGVRVHLVDDEGAPGRRAADQHIDMIAIRALALADVAVVAGHFDLPRLPVRTGAGADRALAGFSIVTFSPS
jgi:hypothetical protein